MKLKEPLVYLKSDYLVVGPGLETEPILRNLHFIQISVQSLLKLTDEDILCYLIMISSQGSRQHFPDNFCYRY